MVLFESRMLPTRNTADRACPGMPVTNRVRRQAEPSAAGCVVVHTYRSTLRINGSLLQRSIHSAEGRITEYTATCLSDSFFPTTR